MQFQADLPFIYLKLKWNDYLILMKWCDDALLTELKVNKYYEQCIASFALKRYFYVCIAEHDWKE